MLSVSMTVLLTTLAHAGPVIIAPEGPVHPGAEVPLEVAGFSGMAPALSAQDGTLVGSPEDLGDGRWRLWYRAPLEPGEVRFTAAPTSPSGQNLKIMVDPWPSSRGPSCADHPRPRQPVAGPHPVEGSPAGRVLAGTEGISEWNDSAMTWSPGPDPFPRAVPCFWACQAETASHRRLSSPLRADRIPVQTEPGARSPSWSRVGCAARSWRTRKALREWPRKSALARRPQPSCWKTGQGTSSGVGSDSAARHDAGIAALGSPEGPREERSDRTRHGRGCVRSSVDRGPTIVQYVTRPGSPDGPLGAGTMDRHGPRVPGGELRRPGRLHRWGAAVATVRLQPRRYSPRRWLCASVRPKSAPRCPERPSAQLFWVPEATRPHPRESRSRPNSAPLSSSRPCPQEPAGSCRRCSRRRGWRCPRGGVVEAAGRGGTRSHRTWSRRPDMDLSGSPRECWMNEGAPWPLRD